MYGKSDKMNAIEGQHQLIQSQYGDGVQGWDDQLCQMLNKSQARLQKICCFAKRKEHIINNFQKNCFSAVTWMIC